MSEGDMTSSDTTADTAEMQLVGEAEGHRDGYTGKFDVSVTHHDDGSATVSFMDAEGAGIECTMPKAFRYDLAQALLEPNGSGFFRTSGRMDRFNESEAERIEREAKAAKAREDAEKAARL